MLTAYERLATNAAARKAFPGPIPTGVLESITFHEGSPSAYGMLTDERRRVWINPVWWKTLSSKERIAMAAHEMGHICYGAMQGGV